MSDKGHNMLISSSLINSQHHQTSFSLGFLLQLMCFIKTHSYNSQRKYHIILLSI